MLTASKPSSTPGVSIMNVGLAGRRGSRRNARQPDRTDPPRRRCARGGRRASRAASASRSGARAPADPARSARRTDRAPPSLPPPSRCRSRRPTGAPCPGRRPADRAAAPARASRIAASSSIEPAERVSAARGVLEHEPDPRRRVGQHRANVVRDPAPSPWPLRPRDASRCACSRAWRRRPGRAASRTSGPRATGARTARPSRPG